MSLIVKIISIELALALLPPADARAQWLVHLSFNLILQLINSFSSDFQNFLNILMAQQFLRFLRFDLLHQFQYFRIICPYSWKIWKCTISNISINMSCFIFRIKPETTCCMKIFWAIFEQLYICITKSKSSLSPILSYSNNIVISTFVIHLMNGVQYLNAISISAL